MMILIEDSATKIHKIPPGVRGPVSKVKNPPRIKTQPGWCIDCSQIPEGVAEPRTMMEVKPYLRPCQILAYGHLDRVEETLISDGRRAEPLHELNIRCVTCQKKIGPVPRRVQEIRIVSDPGPGERLYPGCISATAADVAHAYLTGQLSGGPYVHNGAPMGRSSRHFDANSQYLAEERQITATSEKEARLAARVPAGYKRDTLGRLQRAAKPGRRIHRKKLPPEEKAPPVFHTTVGGPPMWWPSNEPFLWETVEPGFEPSA